MGRKIALREDFDGPGLRRLAKASKDAGQSRRLLALAEIYDGAKRTDAARIGDVGLQVVRDWVLRFNAKGPAGLIDGKATGKPRKLNTAQRRALARIVESGPIPAIHGVVRWRRKDLAFWIFEEKAYPSEPGLTTCWVCGCHWQYVRLMFWHAQPLERRPPDVPRHLRGALSR